MRTLRLSLAGTMILAMLGGLGGAVLAQSEAPNEEPAAVVDRSTDPSASGECSELEGSVALLESQLASVEQQLADVTAERDALVAANVVSEVLATVEGLTRAVNAYDTEAIRTYVTDDYTWQSTGPVNTLEEYVSYVDYFYEQVGFHVVSGEQVVRADGEVYIVESQDVATASGRELIGTTVHRVVADGDGWLIQESRWTEDAAEVAG